MTRRAVIAGASSDIGLALAGAWLERGWQVAGTYRRRSEALQALSAQFSALVECDFARADSVEHCAGAITALPFAWDALVLCPGTMEPIGRFDSCDFDAWEQGLLVNLTAQLRLVRALLASRNAKAVLPPLVLFFAGGGTNSAPLHYSAYTVAKIALIKAVELLDAEMPDLRFAILGPGWVKTKIHAETLKAGDAASAGAAAATRERLAADRFVPMAQVVECCNWLADAPKEVIGGRNFSAAHDFAAPDALAARLRSDPAMYKLRRAGNDVKT